MSTTKPCAAAAARQFDFWLGEWDITWGDGATGTNHVLAILDGCVIQENFDGRPGTPLQGMSVSTYNPARGHWRQTWVDNGGSYLDFVGGFAEGRMVLSRQAVIAGKPVQQRMVWFNIAENTLEWTWERSTDNGDTWQVMWHLHYRRRD